MLVAMLARLVVATPPDWLVELVRHLQHLIKLGQQHLAMHQLELHLHQQVDCFIGLAEPEPKLELG